MFYSFFAKLSEAASVALGLTTKCVEKLTTVLCSKLLKKPLSKFQLFQEIFYNMLWPFALLSSNLNTFSKLKQIQKQKNYDVEKCEKQRVLILIIYTCCDIGNNAFKTNKNCIMSN